MGDDELAGIAVALNGYGLLRDDGRREVLAWRDLVQVAETAEQTGYRAIFTPEIGAREAFSTLTAFSALTSRIRLASGVAPISSRDPRRMAMEAATVHEVSGGRHVLGMGSTESIRATHGYVAAVRALLGGGVARLPGSEGEIPPLDLHPEPGAVPIWLGALGPRMTTLAGEVADGVLLNWCTPERVAQAREQVAAGAAAAGRDADEVAIAVYVRACLGHEDASAIGALAEAAVEYASMPKYRRQFEVMGLGKEAEAAGSPREGGPGRAAEDLVAAVCVWGTRRDALGRLREYADAGADLVVVYPVPALDAASSVMGTVLAAAPSPAVER